MQSQAVEPSPLDVFAAISAGVDRRIKGLPFSGDQRRPGAGDHRQQRNEERSAKVSESGKHLIPAVGC
jgi:hypothetical protein